MGIIEYVVFYVLFIFSIFRVNLNVYICIFYKVFCNIYKLVRFYNVMFEVILFVNISIVLIC